MNFAWQAGLLFTILLPLFILLHFKNRQTKEYIIPSVELWAELIAEEKGIRSFRVQNMLLFILQLLVGVLLVLSIAQPFYAQEVDSDRVTLAMDCSISMKAEEKGDIHFEKAREEAIRYVSNLSKDTRVSIVLMRSQCEELRKNGTKEEAVSVLKKIKCTNDSLNINIANTVLSACSGRKIVFSNRDIALTGQLIKIGTGFKNFGITGARFDPYNRILMCRVKNYCMESIEIPVEITDDKGIKKLKTFTALSQQESWINFRVDQESTFFKIQLKRRDMLNEDNHFVLPLTDDFKKKVLLDESNFFIEKALSCIPEIRFKKVEGIENFEEERDIYILSDTKSMDKLTGKYGGWLLMPPKTAGKMEGSRMLKLESANEVLSGGLNINEILVKEPSFLELPEGFRPLLTIDNKPVMVYGFKNGQKWVYSSIDFSKTNLVLTSDFPILVSNIINWLGSDREKVVDGNPPAELVVGNSNDELTKTEREEPLIYRFKFVLLTVILILLFLEWEVYKNWDLKWI